ncbi:Uncharacterized protein APZ42_023624 [Daphnia magna]|uniref:Uncharacterized protein n=1 Tax=Daphnia magna TaxID=35525 RepID=A0A164UVD3_9CRUS|nr:Uncharacterized protein APZ42_023624 [Daphnia magna]
MIAISVFYNAVTVLGVSNRRAGDYKRRDQLVRQTQNTLKELSVLAEQFLLTPVFFTSFLPLIHPACLLRWRFCCFALSAPGLKIWLLKSSTDRLTNPSTPLTSQRTHRIRLTANQPIHPTHRTRLTQPTPSIATLKPLLNALKIPPVTGV